MRTVLAFVLGLLLWIAAPMTASATLKDWSGTLTIDVGNLFKIQAVGVGTALVNSSGGGAHLSTLAISPSGAVTATGTVPLTNPGLHTLISVQVTASLGAGTFRPISGGGGLTQNVLPVAGLVKLCILFPGCSLNLPIPLTVNGTRGIGIGGTITVNTFSPGVGIKMSADAAPWTLGVAAVTGIPTLNGGTSSVTVQGFVHGPASDTSSTARGSGVVQFVTPMLMMTNLDPPNTRVPVFGVLRLHFDPVPEPSATFLFASGLAVVAMTLRRRR